MCGIVGYVGPRDGRTIIHQGLGRLEYRGYDSAGVALRTEEGLAVQKTAGRVDDLTLDSVPRGNPGVGHTRWATHGPPTVENAHPHLSCDGKIAVVHNGIITNEDALRRELTQRGHTFASDTDTEVIAHLLEEAYPETKTLVDAVRQVQDTLAGSFAFCALHQDHPGELVASRNESPLVLGVGDQECFVASDVVAFLEHTDQAVFLHDGDILHLREGGFDVFPADGREIQIEEVPWDVEEASLAGYPHFMLKEIHEQPNALRQALVGRIEPGSFPLEGKLHADTLAGCTDVHFVACGSSHNASRLAGAFVTDAMGVPSTAHVASEIGGQAPVTGADPLFVGVTQSGETADTLEALRTVRQLGHEAIAVTNVVGSTVTREATAWTPIRAGPEISVAATKSFTGQSLVLGLLAAQLGHARGRRDEAEALLEELRGVPHAVQAVLDDADVYRRTGRKIAEAESCFVLGSGPSLPVAEETALKIKEISYVHAEAFATGALKHGPLALVEDGTPALVLAPEGPRMERAMAAMREIVARGGEVIALTDAPGTVEQTGIQALPVHAGSRTEALFAMTVAGQLIAYEAAVERGCDVDKPRNLAKSVTVK